MYDTLSFSSDFPTELIQFIGGDDYVTAAARVSTKGWESIPSDEASGLLKFLISNRHGSPFEHGLFTWRISAPIFVWREFMRHRIASYNEESGRYKRLDGVFYIPPRNRNLIQRGKPGSYTFVPGTVGQYEYTKQAIVKANKEAYHEYQTMLDDGIAKEVARMVLPVNIYSTAWVSMNPRGLMNFLSLRTAEENAIYKSTPMYEISVVAGQMEKDFKDNMPITHSLFRAAGSVCP